MKHKIAVYFAAFMLFGFLLTAVDATAQGILGLADISLAKLSARGASNAAPRLACS